MMNAPPSYLRSTPPRLPAGLSETNDETAQSARETSPGQPHSIDPSILPPTPRFPRGDPPDCHPETVFSRHDRGVGNATRSASVQKR
jgi:hypothetical protein